MALKTRGGVAARLALTLALVSTIGVLLPGCRKSQPVRANRYFVRVDALLTLHPAWAQVVALEREVAAVASPQPQPTGIALNLPPLPQNFIPPQTIPPSLEQQRQQRLQEDAARYVARLQKTLQARNNEIYSLFEKEQTAATAKEYNRALAAEEARLREEQTAKALILERQIDTLRFRQVAIESQARGFRGQPRTDALVQLNRVTADIADLSARHAQVLASVVPAAIAALEGTRKRLADELQQRLAQRRKELDQDIVHQIAAEQARLETAPPPIPAIGSLPAPPPNLHATPLPLPTQTATQVAMQQALGRGLAAVAEERAVWQRQKEKLIAVIRADIQQAVLQTTRQNGWQIVPEGTPGATDVTALVRDTLRAQWRQNPP